MNNILNKNGKVQEETLTGSNSEAVKAKLRGLLYFKETSPSFATSLHSVITLSHTVEGIMNASID